MFLAEIFITVTGNFHIELNKNLSPLNYGLFACTSGQIDLAPVFKSN